MISVNTPAGYEKKIEISVVKKKSTPKIFFEPEVLTETNKETLTISGKVENVFELFINRQKINIESGGFFKSSQILNKPVNIFEIKAVGKEENSLTLEKKVLFDNQPPQLRSYDLQRIDKNESYYRIIIKADDLTQLKSYSEITLDEDGAYRTEMIKYSKEKNIYEGIINCGGKTLPRIKTITLEDLLFNKKTFEISK